MYDLLTYLFSSQGLETDVAAMPLSLLLAGANMAYGYGQSKKRQREFEQEAAAQDRKRDAMMADLKNISFSPGSGIYELENMRKLQAELQGSEALRRQDLAASRAISALSEDPRNVGALQRITGQDQSDAILARQGQQKVEATGTTAQAELAAADKQRALDREIAMMGYGEASKTGDAYRQGALAEGAAQTDMIMSGISDIANLAMTAGAQKRAATPGPTTIYNNYGEGDFVPKGSSGVGDGDDDGDDEVGKDYDLSEYTDYSINKDDFDLSSRSTSTPIRPIPDYTGILDNAYTGDDSMTDAEIDLVNQQLLNPNPLGIEDYSGNYGGATRGQDLFNTGWSQYGMDALTGQRRPRTMRFGENYALIPKADGTYFVDDEQDYAQGGYIKAEEGGMTEGAFSHDTNKKAIIDQESGEKQGEMTGGEMIFNPDQVDEIEDFIEDDDARGLLSYLKRLLKLPQFRKNKDDE